MTVLIENSPMVIASHQHRQLMSISTWLAVLLVVLLPSSLSVVDEGRGVVDAVGVKGPPRYNSDGSRNHSWTESYTPNSTETESISRVPTPTPTDTPSISPAKTPSATAHSPTIPREDLISRTQSTSDTRTASASDSRPETPTVSASASQVPTSTVTDTASVLPTRTQTRTFTQTDTITLSLPLSETDTIRTPTGTNTLTVSESLTDTFTESPTKPSETLTLPHTPSSTISFSMSDSLLPPPPPPCPTAIVTTVPSPLYAEDIRTHSNITLFVILIGHAYFPSNYTVQSTEIISPDTGGGYPEAYGFERVIRPLLPTSHANPWFYNNSRELIYTMPTSPNYTITHEERMGIVIPSPAVSIVQWNCPQQAIVTGFTVLPDEERPYLDLALTYQTAAGGVAAAAMLVSGMSYATDGQALALLGSTSCGYPYDREQTKPLRYFLSPFANDFSEGAMLLGNLFISLGTIALQYFITKVVAIARFVDMNDACAMTRFPAIASTVVMFLHPGITLVSFRGLIRLESDPGSRVMGFFGTLYVFAVPFLTLRGLSHREASFTFTRYREQGWLRPLGYWGPPRDRQMFGRLILPVHGGALKWCVYPPVLLAIIGCVAAANPENVHLCQFQYGLIVLLFIAAAVGLSFRKPHRIPASNALAAVSMVTLAAYSMLKLISLNGPTYTMNDAMVLTLLVTLSLTFLRVLIELVLYAIEVCSWLPKEVAYNSRRQLRRRDGAVDSESDNEEGEELAGIGDNKRGPKESSSGILEQPLLLGRSGNSETEGNNKGLSPSQPLPPPPPRPIPRALEDPFAPEGADEDNCFREVVSVAPNAYHKVQIAPMPKISAEEAPLLLPPYFLVTEEPAIPDLPPFYGDLSPKTKASRKSGSSLSSPTGEGRGQESASPKERRQHLTRRFDGPIGRREGGDDDLAALL